MLYIALIGWIIAGIAISANLANNKPERLPRGSARFLKGRRAWEQ